MKRRIILMGAVFAAFVGGQAFAQTAGKIAGSPHDLSTSLVGGVDDKGEICVYCHTPHGANNANGPLWNKPATGETYTLYDSTTIDGIVLGTLGNVSIACLTCHDGTQARDAFINAPGTGAGAGGTGTVGLEIGSTIANLGSDLTNDHPIAIQYGSFSADPDFVAAQGTGPWWVDTENPGAAGDGTRDKTDMILFTRDNGSGTEQGFVECATCHDPHSSAGEAGNAVGSDISFMRIANTDSDVCLSCHTK